MENLKGVKKFTFDKRRHALTHVFLTVPAGTNACDLMTSLAISFKKLGRTSLVFLPGAEEIKTACEKGGPIFFPLHAKLEKLEIDAARRATDFPGAIASSDIAGSK